MLTYRRAYRLATVALLAATGLALGACTPARPVQDPSPGGTCTAHALESGHLIVSALSAAEHGASLTVRKTAAVCDTGAPGGEYRLVPTGPPITYRTATETTTRLLTETGKMDDWTAVPPEELYRHVTACTEHRPVAPPYGCHSGRYELTLDDGGQLVLIKELPD